MQPWSLYCGAFGKLNPACLLVSGALATNLFILAKKLAPPSARIKLFNFLFSLNEMQEVQYEAYLIFQQGQWAWLEMRKSRRNVMISTEMEFNLRSVFCYFNSKVVKILRKACWLLAISILPPLICCRISLSHCKEIRLRNDSLRYHRIILKRETLSKVFHYSTFVCTTPQRLSQHLC